VIPAYGTDSEKSSKVLVIGNGESRRPVNLEEFVIDFSTIGCNALHRDFIPDILVCCDRRMAEEATKNPLTKKTEIYVRHDWYHFFRKIKKNKNVKKVPDLPYKGNERKDDPINWGSGGYAILIAAMGFDEIYLIGFDLWANTNSKVNNVYKDTTNYSDADNDAVDPSYWIYQISKIFTLFRDKKFYIINDNQWHMPEPWKRSNVEFINMHDFIS
jgi:hypothetical protein